MPGVNPKERPKWLKWVALIVLILPVFPILAYRISKMVHAQDSDDPEELVQEIKKVNQIGKLFRGEYPAMTIQYRARIAEQRALQNRLEEAQREFSKIREELKDKDSEKAKYVRRYCNFWLANIRGDGGQAQYEARQAAKLSYSSRFLSLPTPDGKDEFDLGFDHELLQAAEDAGMSVEDFLKEQTIRK
ncbi:MAG: hypothetical protein AAF067_02260 [Pseudomonadota bacterium]